MKRLTELSGMRAFIVGHMPASTSPDLASNSIISNWPADLLNNYDQHHMLAESSSLHILRSSTIPLQYDFNVSENGEMAGAQLVRRDLFARFSMPRGAMFPVHDASNNRGIVVFSGDREPFSLPEMMALSYLSAHVYNRLAEIRELDNRATEMLTEREIDCLNWTAAGKTSVEIAEILGLSEHTINHYLNRATRKLDTVNRTQAVAKALRIGLIK
ncbi:DNA-binding CsgD family transcriptional regulator [Rhizobium halophytocola]|uniref:DNA-binding CsgD family transcriptional regulator n=2 Tax=Rhizobium halophytocola TaxID=735519 RepID=A0ABS4DXM6_9HYPH|nr:DNA-binding CsgD family transcriptional regulator [Rhizobium halophytocola]